jgi:hypothetical protein
MRWVLCLTCAIEAVFILPARDYRQQAAQPPGQPQPNDQAKEWSVGPPVISRSEKNLAYETNMRKQLRPIFAVGWAQQPHGVWPDTINLMWFLRFQVKPGLGPHHTIITLTPTHPHSLPSPLWARKVPK